MVDGEREGEGREVACSIPLRMGSNTSYSSFALGAH